MDKGKVKIIKVGAKDASYIGYMQNSSEAILAGTSGSILVYLKEIPDEGVFEYGEVSTMELLRSEIWFLYFRERIEAAKKVITEHPYGILTYMELAKLLRHGEGKQDA